MNMGFLLFLIGLGISDIYQKFLNCRKAGNQTKNHHGRMILKQTPQ